MHMCAREHTHEHTCTHICTYMHTLAHNTHTHLCMHTYLGTRLHVTLHTCTLVCVHTCMHTHVSYTLRLRPAFCPPETVSSVGHLAVVCSVRRACWMVRLSEQGTESGCRPHCRTWGYGDRKPADATRSTGNGAHGSQFLRPDLMSAGPGLIVLEQSGNFITRI